jgi:predicted negative regulator of RcsB-dependent stress response
MHYVLYFAHYYSQKGLTLGLKENVDALKQELSAEEQFLESVIKAEGFFKKYKKLLIAGAAILVAGIVIYLTLDYIKNRDLTLANQALATLEKNPNNPEALKMLENKNPALYELFRFHKAVESGKVAKIVVAAKESKDPVLKDLATYQGAALEADEPKLSAYTQKQDALLKELAVLDDAFLLFEAGKNEEARKRLAQIPVTSQLYAIVQRYAHYTK